MQVLIGNPSQTQARSLDITLDANTGRSLRRLVPAGGQVDVGREVDPWELQHNTEFRRQLVDESRWTIALVAEPGDFVPVGGFPPAGSPGLTLVTDAFGDANWTTPPAGTLPHIVGAGTVSVLEDGSSNVLMDVWGSRRSFTMGYEDTGGGGSISASGSGSLARGEAQGPGVIQATQGGASAHGYSFGAGSRILASGAAAMASGGSQFGGKVEATSFGAHAFGVGASNGLVTATAGGATAAGYADNDGLVASIGRGALASGYADRPGSRVRAEAAGSQAFGHSDTGGYITARGKGSFARGFVESGGAIECGFSDGETSWGLARNGGLIYSYFPGATAFGYAGGAGADIYANEYGATAFGSAYGNSTILADRTGATAFGFNVRSRILASYRGALAHGYVRADVPLTSARIEADAAGAHASGEARDSGYIEATGHGSRAHGAARNNSSLRASAVGTGVSGYATGGGFIEATQYGGRAGGYAGGTAAYLQAMGACSFAHGLVRDGSMYVGGQGGVGFGFVDDPASSMRVYGDGAIMTGHVNSAGRVYVGGQGSSAHAYANSGGYINASGQSAHARGWALNADIYALGNGSMALGFARFIGSRGLIEARGDGCLAVGYSSGAGSQITAGGLGAKNQWQFGPGSTTEDNTLSVGTGPRLKGTTGPPAVPRNGDMWVNAGYLYAFTNGAPKKL